ncbi:uncharacterized protein LOC143188775 [Calliopsis andreniformis]|uniref:uncharacterized protein LOC143188775 n=1 Tax=Calliopsis andreniformis TaxID=337506 RepID=UPI003FCCA760
MMPIVWTESQTLKLVILYSRHECLRNPFHPDFKNILCRYKAYKQIVDSMNICGLIVCDCIKRITYLKTQYCYELSKISAAISCEKFYKPKASWFPIMHEIFFPFIKSYGYVDNSWKAREGKNDTFNDCYDNETCNHLMYSNAVELKKTPNKDYNCTYPNCCCHLCGTKSAIRSKKVSVKSKTDEITDSVPINYLLLRSQKTRIDTGSNIEKSITVEHETQTDVPSFKSECVTCSICAGGDNTTVKSDLRDIKVNKDIKEKKKIDDEFDVFGKNIASQLRSINFEVAVKLKKRIQDLITEKQLGNITSKSVSHTIRLDCCSSSCSDCKVKRMEMICSCGLPLIMIKADQSDE